MVEWWVYGGIVGICMCVVVFLHDERAKLLHLNVSAWSTHNCYYIVVYTHVRYFVYIIYVCMYALCLCIHIYVQSPQHYTVYICMPYELEVLLYCIQCCMEHSSYLIYILTNRWSTPLKKILTLILQHQLHFHTLTWWRTVVHQLCLYMGGWCMSVHMCVFALSIKM